MKGILAAVFLTLGFYIIPVPAHAADNLPPPGSDSWTVPTQFLACSGNPYALCYYSGPDIATPSRRYSDPPVLPCKVDPNGPGAAECTCYAVTDLPDVSDKNPLNLELQYNYVLMTGILQKETHKKTIEECGPLGGKCLNLTNLNSCAGSDFQGEGCQQAEVCSMLGNIGTGSPQTLYKNLKDVTLISTFSLDHVSEHSFGSTACEGGLYAGCMTAPCKQDENGLTTCQCPTVDGPYQIGQRSERLRELGLGCDISPNVWSAANRITPP
ncbi:hypothetical protein [Roseibium marinum]|uniref:Uncharacterized protein n=1 Tax=Roseibium marinum TaxID=281252 RepID=A0A2S3UMW0_9HYPH|nr:hypothetical protein [Roseibium marinum]POF29057.1 hypothetical protein CLV41_11061 [Roseibium marinum]